MTRAREGHLVVIRDGKTVILHPKLGLKDDGWIAVSDTDLKPDEPVVVEGGYNLPDDTEVEVEKSRGVARGPRRARSARPDKDIAGEASRREAAESEK